MLLFFICKYIDEAILCGKKRLYIIIEQNLGQIVLSLKSIDQAAQQTTYTRDQIVNPKLKQISSK